MPRFSVRVLLASLCLFVIPCATVYAQPSVEGQWSGTIPFNNIEAIHTTLLPTGKVMFWQTWTSSTTLWDPVTGQFSDMTSPSINIFCSAHAWLPDGRLLVVGGHIANNIGEPVADIYDPWTDTWANSDGDPNNDVPDMNAGRWYPSATTLGNGDVLVMSGDIDVGENNTQPQIYEYATNSWRDLTTASKTLPLYPRTFLTPDGNVASLSNYGDVTEIINLEGTGSWSHVDNTLDDNLHNYGSAVMYDGGKVAYFGGGHTPTANVSLMDFNDANPQWSFSADTMAQPRRQNDATIFADGTVLITGGTSSIGWNDPDGLIAETEIWDPATGQVSQVADADVAVYRGYHSTATLLPDGRVLITGGDHNHNGAGPFVGSRNAEIYSPAYLFKGERPEVTSAPDSVSYGETFFVETPDGADIQDVLWTIPGSTSHAQNWTQRANHLSFTEVSGGLEISVPENPNEAPPGMYMLFLINDQGVPSMAEWVTAELSTLSADLDGDGDVDGADFLMIQRDQPDLLSFWQEEYSQSANPAAASYAVPEPSTLCMLILTLFAACTRRTAQFV